MVSKWQWIGLPFLRTAASASRRSAARAQRAAQLADVQEHAADVVVVGDAGDAIEQRAVVELGAEQALLR